MRRITLICFLLFIYVFMLYNRHTEFLLKNIAEISFLFRQTCVKKNVIEEIRNLHLEIAMTSKKFVYIRENI